MLDLVRIEPPGGAPRQDVFDQVERRMDRASDRMHLDEALRDEELRAETVDHAIGIERGSVSPDHSRS